MSKKTIEKRFWEKVDKRGSDDCWNWKAYKIPKGYGRFSTKPNVGDEYAHRFSYELANGPIPDKLLVRHSCDNPSCVNPKHLVLGTQKDNMRDASIRRRWDAKRKLSDEDVAEIRLLFASGKASNGDLSRKYNVSASTISNIVHLRQRNNLAPNR